MKSENRRNSDSSQRRDGAGKRFSKSTPKPRASRDGKFPARTSRDGQKSSFPPRADKRRDDQGSDRSNRFDKDNRSSGERYPKRDTNKDPKKTPYAPRPRAEFDREKKAVSRPTGNFSTDKPQSRKTFDRSDSQAPRDGKFSSDRTDARPSRDAGARKPFERPFGYRPSKVYKKDKFATREVKETIRLNKYLAQAGICSRREADDLIRTGLVSVNDEIVVEMGFQVKPTDTVKYNSQTLRGEKTKYLLLNKPKGFITTTDDPKARKTVMELVAKACKERIYPVGRLDRATTGLLLFTNDGDMAKKLTHPSHGAKKIYHVMLDKKLDDAHLALIKNGFDLEDGPVVVDKINYIEDKDKSHVGLELHIGRNRIVRRIFAHLGYEVVKLDRVAFAGLTKKNLPRGTWRFLSPKEVSFLRML